MVLKQYLSYVKRLIYLRHAKSSWKNHDLSDHDRPLNVRGKRDSPFMALKLKNLNIIPQSIHCSDAQRTKETLQYFINEFNFLNVNISYQESLYHASEEKLALIANELEDKNDTAMIVAHNPGLTYLLNRYSKHSIDNVPTCGLFVLKSNCADWASFYDDVIVEHFIFPKKYQ